MCCCKPTRAATVSRANSARCCCTSSTTRPTTAARQQRCCRRQAWTSASPTCWRWSRTPAQATPRLRASTEEPPMQLHAKRVYLAAEPEDGRSEEHTSELQSLMRISYAVFCLKKKNQNTHTKHT